MNCILSDTHLSCLAHKTDQPTQIFFFFFYHLVFLLTLPFIPSPLLHTELKTAETVREAEKKAKETPKSSLRSMNLLNDALLTSLESSSAATLAKKKASAQQQNRQPKSRKGRAQVL